MFDEEMRSSAQKKNDEEKEDAEDMVVDQDNYLEYLKQVEARSRNTSDGVDHSVGLAKQPSDFKHTVDLLASSAQQSPDLVEHRHQDTEKKQAPVSKGYWFDAAKSEGMSEPSKHELDKEEAARVIK